MLYISKLKFIFPGILATSCMHALPLFVTLRSYYKDEFSTVQGTLEYFRLKGHVMWENVLVWSCLLNNELFPNQDWSKRANNINIWVKWGK